jgi:hypothetical protein
MCKINFDLDIIKHGIVTLINLILSISGLVSVLTIYKLYETTLLFYFLLYNIIVSIFSIFHFMRVCKDMLREEIKDGSYVKIKLLLMIASFIWGIIILEHSEIILFYQNNYPNVYVSFINFFIMSSLSILDTIYKITHYFYNKNKIINPNLDSDSQFLAKLEKDFMDDDTETFL